jgi:glyoxylase-like metal-dependent hydrolase (beta-lactamase superfamily II)
LVIRQDYPTIEPWVPKDACDLLLEGPVHPKDIDAVILSHLHFDHTGDVTKFPSAEIIAGEGTAEATSPGWPTAQLSPFDGTVLTHPKFRELSKSNPGYGSLDVFPYAYDFFSDGSFYLLDAPGHMAGHQMGLARTGEKEWVVMGGDCCHHMDLLVENNRTISVVDGPNGQPGFHKDPKAAQESIEKLKKMRAYKNILTLLAHDASLQGKYPPYPATINGWSMREAQGFGQSRTI